MKFVTDLHLHSKYSRAVSQNMTLANMAHWAKLKGINVIATADFTHPFWFEQLKNELIEAGNGLYKLKSTREPVYFLLSCEVSSIYSQGGKLRRIHNLFFFPSLAAVEQFNKKLLSRGANLRSDGRPTVGITAADLAQIALSCDRKALIIPAHAWTPWFSVFGAFSGFDSIGECFGDMAKYIYGIETGLSSDPAMNWQIGDLDGRAILSFSDAHSLEKMGREATVFEGNEVSYDTIYDAIRLSVLGSQLSDKSLSVNQSVSSETDKPITGKLKSAFPKENFANRKQKTDNRIAFTIEFYPEEGKYHFTGHRDCNFSQSPKETAAAGNICPVCKRPLTIGVMHRVEELKSRELRVESRELVGVRWFFPAQGERPSYVKLVPLTEILAESLNVAVATKRVMDCYNILVGALGSEFNVLLKADLKEIERLAGAKIAAGVGKVRAGEIMVEPGYDGKFGVVKIWKSDGIESAEKEKIFDAQLNLFG